MKWVTWENIGIDRIGCAWLILREIDPQAQFLFVTRGGSLPHDAEPFDVPAVRFSHHDGHCSFHAIVAHHNLTVCDEFGVRRLDTAFHRGGAAFFGIKTREETSVAH